MTPPSTALSRRDLLRLGVGGVAAAIVLPPVTAGCAPQPTTAFGAELVNPPLRVPDGGRITGSLTARIADVDIGVGQMVRTYTYDGALPGATWELYPGDVISVDLRNDLPALDPAEQTASHDPCTSHPRATATTSSG